MVRRVHVRSLACGEILLDASQGHHVRDVLRLKIGSSLELFDDGGIVATGIIVRADPEAVSVRVDEIHSRGTNGGLTIASAVPKGDRADWMVEKLSELGVARFVPLITARSIVHPQGQSKRDRWLRIATESAKQSRRAGVMRIDELTSVDALLAGNDPTAEPTISDPASARWYLSTSEAATPIASQCESGGIEQLTVFVGPEGGWTEAELARFDECGLTGVKLTETILRIETASIALAAIAATIVVRR